MISSASTKAEAIQKCKAEHPKGHLIEVKTKFQQQRLEQYFSEKNLTGDPKLLRHWDRKTSGQS